MTTAPVTPSIGSLARTRLAGDAATALGRLRALGTDDGPGQAGADRVHEVLDAEAAVRNKPGARPLRDVRGHVALHDVTFGDEPGRPVLDGVTIIALPGQLIALAGPTGPGSPRWARSSPACTARSGAVRLEDHRLRCPARLRGRVRRPAARRVRHRGALAARWAASAQARALVRDTPVVMLDEPTSGLDAVSESLVMVGWSGSPRGAP
ncbi:MAG: hypothetical protein L0I24_07830 [Pseudonocardia sp.]|nr:hypothetical protein [Pseudonocardia sp.]